MLAGSSPVSPTKNYSYAAIVLVFGGRGAFRVAT